MDLADYVLGKFTPKEEKIVGKEVELAAEAAIEILEKDVETAMNNYNGMNVDG